MQTKLYGLVFGCPKHEMQLFYNNLFNILLFLCLNFDSTRFSELD